MEEARVYRVPDYYEEFTCKGGGCRHSCCQGWPITMSMREYFRLLGLDCTPELRRKLDAGLHLTDSPSPDRYAQLLPDWRGDCPLHDSEGLCRLQLERGPDALCEICRLYPRSPRAFIGHECACSNSCERTLELLFARTQPLGFSDVSLTLPEPEPVRGVHEAVAGHYGAIRSLCIGLLQDRSQPLPARIVRLGRALSPLEAALQSGADLGRLLASAPEKAPASALPAPDPALAIEFLARFNHDVGLGSRSARDYALCAEERFALRDGAPTARSAARFAEAAGRFRQNFPDWEIRFEQMLVNHVFYETFPFSDRRDSIGDAFHALAAVYACTVFLAAAWTFDRPGDEALIDVLAAAFRLIDHSPFDFNASRALRRYTAVQTDAIVLGVMCE